MGISRDSTHKRRSTGGRMVRMRMKRKFEMGRQPAGTKIGEKKITRIRVRGGNYKFRALRLDQGNFAWAGEAVTRKTRILKVAYNATNNELVRTNTLVKGAIIQIDSTPFKAWYLQYYNIDLAKKKEGAKKLEESKKVAPKDEKKKDDKKGAAKDDKKGAAKDDKKGGKDDKKGSKGKETKPAEDKKGSKGKETKPAENKKGSKGKETKPAGDKKGSKGKETKPAEDKKGSKGKAATDDKKGSKGKETKPAGDKKGSKGKETKKSVKEEKKSEKSETKKSDKKSEKKSVKKDEGPTEKTTNLEKYKIRNRDRYVDEPLMEQFKTGRIYAKITSRPGQSGRCDGYILEGDELVFYLKKINLKKKKT